MSVNFDKIVDRFHANTFKQEYFKNLHNNRDLISLTTADYDVECPDEIREETHKIAEYNCLGYTLHTQEHKQNICDYYNRHHNLDIKPEHVQLSNTGMNGIAFCLAMALKYGMYRKVTLILPEYSSLFSIIESNDFAYNAVEMTYDEIKKIYEVNFKDLEEKLKTSSCLFFSNPHNPNGHLFTREEMQKILDLCRKYNVVCFSDEVWSEIVLDKNKKFISILSIADKNDSAIALFSPGKTFNIAGIGTGIIITKNEKLLGQYIKEMQKMGIRKGTESIFAINLIDIAVKKCDYWMEAFVSHIKKMVDEVINFCREKMPRINIIRPESTTLIMLDFTKMNYNQEQAQKFCLDAGVCLSTGSDFYRRSVPIMRMNVASYTGLIQEALNRLWKKYQEVM